MSPTALSRIFFGPAVVLAVLLSGGDVAAQAPDPSLERTFADWQKRRERIRSAHYRTEGEHVIPKGALGGVGLAPSAPPEPPRDVSAPVKWSMLLDLSTNRHRLEFDEKRFDSKTGQFFSDTWTNMFDGTVLRGTAARRDNHPPGREPAPTDPDAGIYTGDMRGAAFEAKMWPMFLGLGIIVPPGEEVYPGKLHTTLDIEMFRVHGRAVHGGRPCLVIRCQPGAKSGLCYEYWVDTARDSSVVRLVRLVEGKTFGHAQIQYQQTQEGWLPKEWTYSLYGAGSKITYSYHMRVKQLEVNPSVADDDFRPRVEPEMLVRKMHIEAPASGPPAVVEKETRYFRAEEGGGLSEVEFSGGVERRKWRWLS